MLGIIMNLMICILVLGHAYSMIALTAFESKISKWSEDLNAVKMLKTEELGT